MRTKGDTSRGRILEVARHLFNTKGFGATTMSDLVHATGMQKGGLYFHFPEKDAIARAALEGAAEEFKRFLSEALAGDDPGASLERFFRLTLERHKAAGFVGGCIFGNTALETSDSDPALASVASEVFDDWIARVAATVAAAQRRGQVHAEVSPRILAKQVIATVEGGIMMSRLKKDERPLRECLQSLRSTLGLRQASSSRSST